MPYVLHLAEHSIEAGTLGDGTDTSIENPCNCGNPGCTLKNISTGENRLNWIDTFSTAGDARIHCTTAHKVTFICTEDERYRWHERERGRNRNSYIPAPWADTLDPVPFHFLHLSLNTPGMVAYTPSEEKGYLDKQTTVKPGRYLQQFYPNLGADVVRKWAEAVIGSQITFSLATTAAEIRQVYVGGPQSCMSHTFSDGCRHDDCANDGNSYCRQGQLDTHPTVAYAGSDLAIAYYGKISKVSARCVVWPDKKRYGRLYGGTSLGAMLDAAGYTKVPDMRGARIRIIDVANGYIVPYVDPSGSEGYISGKWIVIGSGNIDLARTDGRSEDPEPEPDWTCDDCDDGHFDGDDSYTVISRRCGEWTVCEHCYENNYCRCEDCGDAVHIDRIQDFEGDNVCQSCWEIHNDASEEAQAEREAEDARALARADAAQQDLDLDTVQS